MTEFDGIPKIVFPDTDSDGYWDSYATGEKLDKQFPNQEADELASAIYFNLSDFDVEGEVTFLKCIHRGENDVAPWLWIATIGERDVMIHGWCDYTGWDCQSGIEVADFTFPEGWAAAKRLLDEVFP